MPSIMLSFLVLLVMVTLTSLLGCASTDPAGEARNSPRRGPFLIVLGSGQDAGVPQAGAFDHPGWDDFSRRRLATSLGLVDPRSGRQWIFDATPDFPEQFHRLHDASGQSALSGLFITHAHIGHYTGLMFLGHESMGASSIPVHVMPRMRDFLESNAPWDQLVRYENIELCTLAADAAVELDDDLHVTPILVPHRQEYAEVVGYRIDGPNRSALYIPDIDSWEEWDEQGTRIEDLIAEVDVAFLDGTFYANGEIPGRDMSGFPHPFISHSIDRFADLPTAERAKIHFIHLNHSNPAQRPDSRARRSVKEAGMQVADELDQSAL